MWVIVVGALGVLVVVIIRTVHDDAEILRDWDKMLSPWGREMYQALERRVEGDARMVDYAYERAFMARNSGSIEEAVRLLEVGLQVVERTSPEMVSMLREMAVASRMAAAISPIAPLRPQSFRLPRLSTIVVFAALAHHFLLTAAERYRLRAWALERGFGLVRRLLLQSTRRIRENRVDPHPDWDRVAAARADLRALSAASLRTFHALLMSLSAEQS